MMTVRVSSAGATIDPARHPSVGRFLKLTRAPPVAPPSSAWTDLGFCRRTSGSAAMLLGLGFCFRHRIRLEEKCHHNMMKVLVFVLFVSGIGGGHELDRRLRVLVIDGDGDGVLASWGCVGDLE